MASVMDPLTVAILTQLRQAAWETSEPFFYTRDRRLATVKFKGANGEVSKIEKTGLTRLYGDIEGNGYQITVTFPDNTASTLTLWVEEPAVNTDVNKHAVWEGLNSIMANPHRGKKSFNVHAPTIAQKFGLSMT
ncbi:hypothetical protein BV20DRAFT_976029 [Pilatotrama ljubarskyi]|nr:hypothetical protein BV20DRAFT_976029 [Pilatotrama ljubarskyi]